MGTEEVAVMPDGIEIPYRVDGNSDPNGPLVVLSSPSLVELAFWDEFVVKFTANPRNQHFRILRYNNRGRSRHVQDQPLTLDILTEDVVCLLDKLNVHTAAGMAGISLGGMCALDLALKHPDRIAGIMACDFFPASPPRNADAWNARVEVSRQDKMAPTDANGTRLVGPDLAQLTVSKWLAPKSLNGGLDKGKIDALEKMVSNNLLEGLVNIVQAISSYDLRNGLEKARVRALFVAGKVENNPLIEPMQELARQYGQGAEFRLIEDAGHLPVVDRVEAFTDIFTDFLGGHGSL